MNQLGNVACTICGEETPSTPSRWFLITENRWEDKLKILSWNDGLAARDGMHGACGTAHVQELVIHWMATGSLDYPFARTGPCTAPSRRWSDNWAPRPDVDTQGIRPVGELSVHRESMRRMLTEDPAALKSILDALGKALQVRPDNGPELEYTA
jgi:hypothetical protein